jgi:cytochrome c553
MRGELFMKNFVWVLALALLFVVAIGAQAPKQGSPAWAFLIPDKEQPPNEESSGPIHVPGSNKTYTAQQIDDLNNPPDWFPDEHSQPPQVVIHGNGQVLACGACHLMASQGHPESADLAGLPADYIARQMAYFKSGARKDPARMNAIAKTMSDADIRQAAEWFASLKPKVWVRVVETDTVPKSFVSARGRMRLPMPGGGMEPLGNRIVELPEDAARATSRDPHSGFVAYVPKGSIAKGQALVNTGGNGKTIACTICHGDSLKGLGDVPRIAGLHPLYIGRQLYSIQTGESNGNAVALMKKVVANLNADDMLAIAAYVSSQAP